MKFHFLVSTKVTKTYFNKLISDTILPSGIGQIKYKAKYGISDENQDVRNAQISHIFRLITIVLIFVLSTQSYFLRA